MSRSSKATLARWKRKREQLAKWHEHQREPPRSAEEVTKSNMLLEQKGQGDDEGSEVPSKN